MKYELWSDENIKTIKSNDYFKALNRTSMSLGDSYIKLIREANSRHTEAMFEKDLEIAKLETELKLLKDNQ